MWETEGAMSLLRQNKCFRRLGFAAVAALGLGFAAMPTAPAQARELISIGGFTFPIGGHVHHDYWRNGGWYHDSWSGWHYIGDGWRYNRPYGYGYGYGHGRGDGYRHGYGYGRGPDRDDGWYR
jgi:hypothetical protein